MSVGGVGGKVLARNTILNLLGLGAPMLVAVVAIPLLITSLGAERFGVLTIAWMTIGYFSVFDLGLSRALTQRVAQELGAGREEGVPRPVWTALLMMVLMGLVGMVVVGLCAPWLVTEILTIPEPLNDEGVQTFQLLALSLPWVIATAGLRGFLEAKQRFGMINAVRVPMGVFTFLGPLLVLPFSVSLVPIVALLAAARVLGFVAHLLLCLRTMPNLRRAVAFDRGQVAPLLRSGGWMTVSNIISPLMVYFDRFLIGAMLTMTAVAYYVTPYEVVTRLWLIPSALHGVLFPAFAETSIGEGNRTATLLDGGVRAAFIALFPVVLILVTFAPEALGLWLNSDFALHSTPVLQLLAVGVFINSVGQLPFSAVQAVGRPELTGKLHLAELPLYLVALWWLIGNFGIVGAALAWTLRVVVDTIALFVMTRRLVPGAIPLIRPTATRMTIAVGVLAVATVPTVLTVKIVFVTVMLAAFALTVWNILLTAGERSLILSHLHSKKREAVSST